MNLTDDQIQAVADMGFNFPYYGSNYSRLDISANGFVRLNTGLTGLNFSNVSFATNCGSATYLNFIAPLWDDWNSDAGTNVTWGPLVGGGYGVTWVRQGATYLGGTAGNYATFQVALRPNGVIDLILNDINIGSGGGNNGATATIGINGNNTTTECSQYSFNTAVPAGVGTVTYTPSVHISAMVATPVTTCGSNGTTYTQPVNVSFNSAPVAGTTFQVCYQTSCNQNQATASPFLAAPYVCQTFMATGATTQLVNLVNVPCNSMANALYGTYGPAGISQPIYIGCTPALNFTTPAGLPCTLVCPADQTVYLGSLECCAPANYPIQVLYNCDLPLTGTVTSLGATTATGQPYFAFTSSTTGNCTAPDTGPACPGPADVPSATRAGNVITLSGGSCTSSANYAIQMTYGGTFSFNWAYNNTCDGTTTYDDFRYQVIRGGTVISTFTTPATAPGFMLSGSASLAVMPGDVILFTQAADDSWGPTITTVTFTGMTLSGTVKAVADVVTGPAPGEPACVGVNPVQINLINPVTGAVLQTCNFNITVIEAPAAGSLVCNDHVNISLSDQCQAIIEPDDVLEGSQYSCADNYEVAVSKNPNGPWTTPAIVTEDNCGTWYYRVRDLTNGNSCWGTLLVEDKLAPVLTCGSCPGGVFSGVLEASDALYPANGFGGGSCAPAGGTCGNFGAIPSDIFSFTLPTNSSGTYNIQLTSNVNVTTANYVQTQLGISLFSAPPDQVNSCTNLIIHDGQAVPSAPGVPLSTINGCFNNVSLTPGNTYWVKIQYPRVFFSGAAGAYPNVYTWNVIDVATGQGLLSPDACAVSCVDKPALLDFVAKKNINGIVNTCGIPTPEIVSGYCGGAPQWTVKLKGDYTTACGGYLILEWGLKEKCGMSAYIECRVDVEPMGFDDIFAPEGVGAPVFLECKDGVTPEDIAAKYGVDFAYPYFIDKGGNFIPVLNVCNFFSTYSDIELDACAPHCHGNKKVIRKWTVLDWCEGTLAEATQIIKAVDQEAPTFIVKDTMVSTRPWDCTGDFYLPIPWELHDNCDANPKWEVVAPEGVWVAWDATVKKWRASGVPCGVTTFTYKATDCCGNIGTRTIDVTVKDRTAPVAVAKQDIVISLVPGYDANGETDGQAKMFVASVDNGSWDNCSGIRMEIRRTSGPDCGNIGLNGHNNNSTFSNAPSSAPNNSSNDTDFGEFVKFCCADIPDDADYGIVQVEMRVWDDGNKDGIVGNDGDNWNLTWANVRVDCKIPPVITCPPDATIYCDWAIPSNPQSGSPGSDIGESKTVLVNPADFAKTGIPTAYGVCVKPVIRYWDREFFNQCDLGYILRTFVIKDKGYTRTCVQRIDVLNSLASAPWVFIPSSLSTTPIAITNCDGPTDQQKKDNAPKYTAGPCDVIGVSTKEWQFDFEDGVCRKWKVEYKYVNWCTLEERGPYYKYFIYEDTKAPTFTSCRDTMYAVDANCEAMVMLEKTAVDTSGCITTGWLKWEVYIDLWADGTNDYLFSSFYTGPDGAERVIGGDVVKQYKLGPGSQFTNLGGANATSSGQKLKITIPEKIVGKMSNHKVSWKVTDGCHNFTTCHESFMVADKKAPTPVCVPLSTALMQDPDGNGPLLPMVELWAIDFMVKAYDNCTDEDDLLFTFDDWKPQIELKLDANGNPMSVDHPHFFGANGGVASAVNPNTSAYASARAQYLAGNLQLWIPANRSSAKVWVATDIAPGDYKEVDVHVTVWDKKFNHDYCWTSLKLLNSGTPSTGSISGRVRTATDQAVSNVTVKVDAPIVEYPKAVNTPADGTFDVEVLMTNDYTVTASKDGDDLNGVSTLDLVLIQRHILGIQTLNSPYKLIAADANNDGKITASDLTDLRKLILGITAELPKNDSWRFPVVDQNMEATNPFPFVEAIQINNMDQDMVNQNFVAVKIGDVNGNVSTNVSDPSAEGRSNRSMVMSVDEKAVVAGEVVEIPVTAANFNDVMGFQYTMNLNGASLVEVQAGKLEMNAANTGDLGNGVVTMSYASNEAVTAGTNEVLFTLVVKANRNMNVSEMLSLNSAVTAAESYNSDLAVGKVGLEVRTAPVAGIELFQNEPNPFRGQTTVSFMMPEAAKAKLSIYDVTGKLVTVRNIEANKGLNSEVFTKEQLGVAGVMYYTLTSGEFTATKKMIIIE